MDAERFFATEWAGLVPGLHAALARAGATAADREDLVQETATRLFASWETVDYERGVAALARRIALNAWRDQWRRRGRHEVVADPPERADAIDTERVALARLQVTEVARVLQTLPRSTATVLRVAASEAEDGACAAPASAALRMARTRARRALAACLQAASGVAAFGVVAMRGLSRSVRTSAALGTAVGVAFVMSVGGGAAARTPAVHWGAVPDAARVVTVGSVAAVTRSARAPLASGPVHGARGLARRSHAAAPPYYYVDPGPARAGVFVDLDIAGNGVRVSNPQPGDAKPVCLYGDAPGVPSVSRCPSR